MEVTSHHMTQDDVRGITLESRWPSPRRALPTARITSIVVNLSLDSSMEQREREVVY